MNDLDVDPALAAAVLEIETHISEAGWDQPARLYALVETARIVEREPALAAAMGLDSSAAQGSLTPVEQDQLAPDSPLERVLESVTWPPSVSGCAAVVERLVLPPEVDADIPEDPADAERVRPRAPRSAGGADRGRRHAWRVDVLCIENAGARRRPVGRGRQRPGAGAAAAAGRHPGGRRVSNLFDDDPRRPTPRGRTPPPRRSRALVITASVLVVGFFALTTSAGFFTDRMWYAAVGFPEVFSTLFWTRAGLFLVFGALMAVVVGANMYLAYRLRPMFRPNSPEQTGLDRYRDAVDPIRTWLLVGVAVLLGLFAGTSASGQWREYLLWRNGTDFGTTDKYFDRDIGFYVFDLPWLHYLVDSVMAFTVVAVLMAALVHYLYGGVRLQTSHDRLSGAAQAQLSVLVGVFVLAKAGDYWLDRFDLVHQSGRLITGVTYTDDHAVLPAKNILMAIAIICAVLFFANVLRRTWLLPSVGLALLALSAILLGMIWPGIVQQFQVEPTEADKEAPYIEANIDATRAAYDLEDVEVEEFTSEVSLATARLGVLALQTSTIPLVDPKLVAQTFEQQQQVRAYYSVSPVLDVDRYRIEGEDRALVLGVRELDQDGITGG